MKHLKLLLFATAALGPLPAPPSYANPLDGTVVAGSASIDGTGTGAVKVNQSTDKAIIDWNTFDIGSGEVTTFVQPDSTSVVLNRVTGSLGPSQIIGTLSANGQVFLVNRDGILFGKDAVVDTGALVATTHDIANDAFLAGRYDFGLPGNPTASVVNLGEITVDDGGYAALVAPGVRNDGVIAARLGKVGLASGNGFALDLYGDNLIKLAVGDVVSGDVIDVATGETLRSLVSNGGLLSADGGTVQLTATATRAIVDSVINNTGNIEANSVGMKNGKIVLSARTADGKATDAPAQRVKVSGRLSASSGRAGETGGDIEITGEEIALAVATIDAFGWNGGGHILIGGDVGGGRSDWSDASAGTVERADHAVATASAVTVDAGSRIDASALASGDGGKVVIWSDEGTNFAGTVLAQGGTAAGDGGFAEISGRRQLAFGGSVDVGAPAGAAGVLLLDPQDIAIGGEGAWTIDPGALETALNAGNVFLYTSGAEAGTGDIRVNAIISYDRNWLMLAAHRNIIISDGAAIVGLDSADEVYPASLGIMAGGDYDPIAKKLTGTGDGTLLFEGSGLIEWYAERIGIAYNPVGGYANPTDFGANIRIHTGMGFEPYSNGPTFMWVNDAQDLQNVSLNLTGRYVLSDVKMAGVSNFTPIGSSAHPFNGTMWGNVGDLDMVANTISDLSLTSAAENVGLFGVLGEDADIRAINLEGANVVATSADASVGVLAGVSLGSISNVRGDGKVEAKGLSSIAGGLVGTNEGRISESGADVVTIIHGADPSGANGFAGGLVGWNRLGTIGDAFATGDVSNLGVTGATLGGLVGVNTGGDEPLSWASDDPGRIFGGYALGNVTSPNSGSTAQPVIVGGLIGLDDYGRANIVYAAGTVSGAGQDLHLGGLIGLAQNPYYDGVTDFYNSYWDIDGTGQSGSAGGTGASKATIQSIFTTSLGGFDVDAGRNGGYPYLEWEVSPDAGLHEFQYPRPVRGRVSKVDSPTTSNFVQQMIDSWKKTTASEGYLVLPNITNFNDAQMQAAAKDGVAAGFGKFLGVEKTQLAVGPMFAFGDDRLNYDHGVAAVRSDPELKKAIAELVGKGVVHFVAKVAFGSADVPDMILDAALQLVTAKEINDHFRRHEYAQAAAKAAVLATDLSVELFGKAPGAGVVYDVGKIVGMAMTDFLIGATG